MRSRKGWFLSHLLALLLQTAGSLSPAASGGDCGGNSETRVGMRSVAGRQELCVWGTGTCGWEPVALYLEAPVGLSSFTFIKL